MTVVHTYLTKRALYRAKGTEMPENISFTNSSSVIFASFYIETPVLMYFLMFSASCSYSKPYKGQKQKLHESKTNKYFNTT